MHVELLAQSCHVLGVASHQRSQPRVGESHALQHAQVLGVPGQAMLADAVLHGQDAGDLFEEPRIDLAHGVHVFDRGAHADRLRHHAQAVGRRGAQRGADGIAVVDAAMAEAGNLDLVEAGEAGLQPAQRLLQRFLEGAADRHDLADRLHGGGQHRLGAGELLEGEARDLGDDVVDARLEAGRRGAAGDVVLQLVQRVADSEFCRDLGDREAGRLRGQRGRARDARVHLDDHEAAVGGVDGELHVGAAGLHADLAQHRDRGVAHQLVFLVGQGQRRRHGDGIAGVHAHRVDVLDRADDDAVVRPVADHLHLIFLPAEHALLDQHFGGRRGVEAGLHDLVELRAVEGDAATGAAEREGRPDDRRQADMVERLRGDGHGMAHIALLAVALAEVPLRLQRVERGVEIGRRFRLQAGALGLVLLAIGILGFGGVGQHRLRRFQADLVHGLAKQRAVFGLVDGMCVGADHLDGIALQHAHSPQRQCGIERGLAAHCRQQRVGPLLGDDLGHHFRRDRLDIGGVGQLRVGHDGGRVGVDQDDAKSLFLQRLARLGSGIIELAGLADNDGAGPDDQDRLDIGALWHLCPLVRQAVARAKSRDGRPAGLAHDSGVRLGGPYRGRFSAM